MEIQEGRIPITEEEQAQLDAIPDKVISLTRDLGVLIATLEDGTEVVLGG